MPRVSRPPYECPRCGYETALKCHMVKHFRELKKPCPTLRSDTELTEDVKAYVLANRVFRDARSRVSMAQPPPAAPPPNAPPPTNVIVQNIINQYNTVNNFLNCLDPIDKVNKYMGHRNQALTDFDSFVGRKYASTVQRLERGSEQFYRPNDFLQLVNEVSNPSGIEEFNLMYDAPSDKVKIYEFGGWREFLTSSGLLRIVETLKDNLLDAYELSLVQKMRNRGTDPREQAECREYLVELYRFLAAFKLEPHVTNLSNEQIMGGVAGYDGDEGTDIEEACCSTYREIRDSQPSAYVNKLMRDIGKIVQKNSAVAVRDVNRAVLELFNSDVAFREVLLQAVPTAVQA